MIVFSSLQVRRGVRVLLDNATATINPGQKVGLVGKNGCGKSTLLALLKGELQAEAGSVSFPGNWSMAWVNQETPHWMNRRSSMSLTVTANSVSLRQNYSRRMNRMTATPLP